jgi:hypothetical protein
VDEIRSQIVKVLDDPSYRDGATSLRQDWLARPAPAEIIPDLEKLAARDVRD